MSTIPETHCWQPWKLAEARPCVNARRAEIGPPCPDVLLDTASCADYTTALGLLTRSCLVEFAHLELLFLGTGTSHGVPIVGCDCGVCTSADRRDRRMRASALLAWGGCHVVVDTATDFRQQMLVNGIRHVDALLYTHAHADHTHGIDDIRVFTALSGRAMPTYADRRTCAFFRRTFRYIFAVNPGNLNVPRMDLHEVDRPFELLGERVTPVPVEHGDKTVLGFRVGALAYVPDCSGIPRDSVALLGDLDVLALDALRATEHPTHFSLSEALEAIERLRPRRAYLTGLSHKLGHAVTAQQLPPHVDVAYDGLRVRTD